MNPYARPDAYRQSSVLTASPQQLVVMLYDGAARFLYQAEAALKDSDWATAGDRLTRAEDIITELQNTLDLERGGEVAVQLQSLYLYSRRRLVEARIRKDPRRVREVSTLLRQLRGAWAQSTAAQVPA